MKLQGKRVLLNKPEFKKPSIELSEESKEALEKEQMKNWLKIEIFEVGEDVTNVKKGDKVYVPSYSLQNSEAIPFDEEIKLLINEAEIAIIW
jgi:hypothetical protein